ncbi:energy transducer TonB [Marilutibacter chinensis]|uniref:Energy transducer TonB n=1 Tax=Marilutibacter chinensis TaxID=2912247 RepID=A0ABS9HXF1_9GAMM|nr:energy transducer TonB [Lysobacter chinensis]MCF7223551.1 energy transducer TonB [Lysobacter chinensis]
MEGKSAALAACMAALAGCTFGNNDYLRPGESIVDDGVVPACTGDYDTAPALVAAKAPVFPVSMLNPTLIEDRKTRRLPMSWQVDSSFDVGADGVPANIRTSATDPTSFGHHTTIAIRAWRFAPATRGGLPVTAACTFSMSFDLG